MVRLTDYTRFIEDNNHYDNSISKTNNRLSFTTRRFTLYYDELNNKDFEMIFDIRQQNTDGSSCSISIYDNNNPADDYTVYLGLEYSHFRIKCSDKIQIYKDNVLVHTINSLHEAIVIRYSGSVYLVNYSLTRFIGEYTRITNIVGWLKNWFYTKGEIVNLQLPSNWTSVTYNSGYADYGNDWPPLKYRQLGNIVEIRGVWKPTANKSTTTTPLTFATIPSDFAPANTINKIMPAPGHAKYLFEIDSAGNLKWSRYGITDYTDMSSGNWCPVQIIYMLG